MRIVAFSGPKGSGKDTAAKALLERGSFTHRFRKAPMAEGVKNICSDFFGWTPEQMDNPIFKEHEILLWPDGPRMEPRWPMMDIANFLRDHYGGEIHIQRWLRHAQASEFSSPQPICHVMTDLRFPEEHDMLLEQDALIIYIARKEMEEVLARKQAAGDKMALNPSEMCYGQIKGHPKTVIIPNDGEIYQLHLEVHTALKIKYGHPKTWVLEETAHAEG